MLAYGGLDECEYIIEGVKVFPYGGAGNKWMGMKFSECFLIDQILCVPFQNIERHSCLGLHSPFALTIIVEIW